MDWKTYEKLTKDIYEVLGKGAGVKIECYGSSCKITGKSGVEHQVDVLTSHSDGIHTYRTIIECKYWKNKINKDIVMKVVSIKDDCNIDKAVIVSQMGFTQDGISYAEHVGVDLVELREPLDKDWEGRIRNIVVNMHIRIPNITRCENLVDEVDKSKHSPSDSYINTEDYYYEFNDGVRKTLKSFCEEFISSLTEIGKEVTQEIDFPANTFLKSNDKRINQKVKGLRISGFLSEATEKIVIRGENYIQMIMKSVFSGKQFIVTEDGEIREVDRVNK